MPRRRWRLLDRRTQPTAAERTYFETGVAPPLGHPERGAIKFFDAPRLHALWRQHGRAIAAAWADAHHGAQPWAWQHWGPPDAA